MKYIFKLLFGASVMTHNTNNIFSHFALKPLRGIFGFLTGSSTKGMMGHFEERRFLNFSNKGLVLDGKDKRLSQKESFNHMGIIARTGGGKTTGYIIPNCQVPPRCSTLSKA